MSNLALVKSEEFDNRIECNFYSNEQQNEVWMTRRQIGNALDYAHPNQAIKNIHSRHRDRFKDKSRVAQIDTPSGGNQRTTIYNRKGMMEICRHSDKSKADKFMDWVWEVIDEIMTTGSYSVYDNYEIPDNLADALELAAKLERQNKKLRPKAEKYEGFVGAQEGSLYVGEVAKSLDADIGRNRLFTILRELNILQNDNIPYQRYKKYFNLKQNEENGKVYKPTPKVKPKGVEFIYRKLVENGYIEQLKLMRVK